MKCSKCGSQNTNKKGERATYQLYYCNDCHKNFKVQKKERTNIKKEIENYIKNSNEKYWWLVFAIFSAIYFFTYINANNKLLVDAFHDDALYFWLGQNISDGNWLGKYMQLTLAKMPSYAMFIAFSIKIGIPYLWLFSLCHIIAVSFLIVKSKYLFSKAKWLLFILGILLLFNPILATYLRIYRFQLPAICFIVFIASLISMFNPASKKKHWVVYVIDALIVSIAWGFLWFSREESLFYVGCIVVAMLGFFLVKKFISNPIQNLYPIVFGVSGVVVFWLFISSMNYKHYDRFVVCERTSSPYTDVIKTFNSIVDPDFPTDISGSSASREKIINIAETIPMFKPMAKNLIASAINYRGVYFNTKTLSFVSEPENVLTISHFEWAWIAAASATGYYKNATTLAAFYTKLNNEMKKAIREGKLKTKTDNLVQVGPYALSNSDITAIIKLLPKNYFKLFPKPTNIAQNFLASKSPVGNDAKKKIWGEKLKINYITKGDAKQYKKELDSFSNKLWNKAAIVYAYTAIPLMHLATLLAFIAIIISLIRKQWVYVAIITVISSTYIAHYLMITAVCVISSFNAANHAYFLPSYATILINAFLSISVILNLQKPLKPKTIAANQLPSSKATKV